jgi:acyl-CoA thioester hydrolase
MSLPAPPLPADGRFEGKVHLFPVRVFFEDTDLSGVVYHANYLRYMERARSDMLRVAGIDQRAAQESGEGVYAVSALEIAYRQPARLDDILLVESRLLEVTVARCIISQIIKRGEAILTQGCVTAAFLAPDGRPRRQPRAWIDLFKPLIQEQDTAS